MKSTGRGGLGNMMRSSALLLALIAFQFWLGMYVNLFLNIPVTTTSFPYVLSYYANFSVEILMHIINGFLILGTSFMYLYFAIKSRTRSFMIISIVGLIAITSAIINGILFLLNGLDNGNSIGMAMSAVSALITYSIGLYYLGIYRGSGFSVKVVTSDSVSR